MSLHFEPRNIIKNIVSLLEKELTKTNAKHMVIGISGGLDSAVTAALAELAGTNIGVPLVGYVLPIEQKPIETARACEIATKFTHAWSIHDLTSTYKNMRDTFWSFHNKFSNAFESGERYSDNIFSPYAINRAVTYLSPGEKNISNGNIKARIRMMWLYYCARILRGPVLSTDNYSEWLQGYWTLNGDVGNLSPIQQIFKGIELPYIAEELGIPSDIINAVPTDGLGITNSDMDQLGAKNYVELDKEMLRILNGVEPKNPEAAYIKRYYDPIVNAKRNDPRILTRNEIGMPTLEFTYECVT